MQMTGSDINYERKEFIVLLGVHSQRHRLGVHYTLFRAINVQRQPGVVTSAMSKAAEWSKRDGDVAEAAAIFVALARYNL